MWKSVINCGRVGPGIASSSFHCSSNISTLWLTGGGLVSILNYKSMSASWEITTSGKPGVNALNHPWMYQGRYVFPLPSLVTLSLSTFLVEHVTCQFRLLILVAACLMEVFWLLIVFNMWEDWEDITSRCPIIKVLSAQGFSIIAFHLLAAQRQVLCLKLSCSCWGWLWHSQQRFFSKVGKNG